MNCARCGHTVAETDCFCAACGAALLAPATEMAEALESPAPLPPPMVHQELPKPLYAGFWRRLIAMLVDGLILFFPQSIVRVLLGLHILSYEDQWDDARVVTAECVTFALALLYGTLLECSAAQGTLGQQLLGLRVTTMNGERIGFGRSLGRHLAKLLSVVLCGMGYLLQLWNGRRQTLHDMIAGCLVVRAESHSANAMDADSRASIS